ncbi:MAG: transposase [Cyclobacteriaceae bacterium]
MIVSKDSDALLSGIMRDMKKFTSSKLLEAIGKEPESRREWMLAYFRQEGESNSNNKMFQVWQQDNHPIECGNAVVLRQKMEYLHENPVRAGFVEKAEDWVYSSAGHYYCGKKSLIELSYV